MRERIASGVDVFTLPADRGDFSTCIVTLGHENWHVLIDAGYERHAATVVAAIGGEERILAVVLSHNHEDHVHGCRSLPHTRMIAATGTKLVDIPDHELEEVRDGESREFGDHRLQFFELPGHSRHHLGIVIDGIATHVGDLLIHTGDGTPTPPYLGYAGACRDHLQSLVRLLDLSSPCVIPGHGPSSTAARPSTKPSPCGSGTSSGYSAHKTPFRSRIVCPLSGSMLPARTFTRPICGQWACLLSQAVHPGPGNRSPRRDDPRPRCRRSAHGRQWR